MTDIHALSDPDHGIHRKIVGVTPEYVVIEEMIDLRHPACPVVAVDPEVIWAMRRIQMAPTEFTNTFGEETI